MIRRQIKDASRNVFSIVLAKGPPVITAPAGEIEPPYPRLEGRFSQTLPRIPGKRQSQYSNNQISPGAGLEAWLVPRRAGTNARMSIAVRPGTYLVLDVRDWPILSGYPQVGDDECSRDMILRRAARLLSAAPGAFATVSSINSAYEQLEELWNDQELGSGDRKGDLLKSQAQRLQTVLEELAGRPRALLRSEHRMLKLQAVRRIDAKTLRWLSAKPGKNTAERAGSRQRIRAPKRYETIATLENGVLRAFAALTVRETGSWLDTLQRRESDSEQIRDKGIILAHHLRAKRIVALLRGRGVREAKPPVLPNFPLRFDPRYREIWRAWEELRGLSGAMELEWMWQDRTFTELLGLRAAMMLHRAARKRTNGGTLSHSPVLGDSTAPNQGRYLDRGSIGATLAISIKDLHRTMEFRSGEEVSVLGAAAEAGTGTEIWWRHEDDTDHAKGGIVGLPWRNGEVWDELLRIWAEEVISKNEEICNH